jgi:hypothetical protein
MQITRSTIKTQKGPADWFTGDVYIDGSPAQVLRDFCIPWSKPKTVSPGSPPG